MSNINKKTDKVRQHSSSWINGCSLRVHVNPILQDLLIAGQLHSDLEFALQNGDVNLQTQLANNQRVPSYGNQGSRHATAQQLAAEIDSINSQISDIESEVKSEQNDNLSETTDNKSVTNEK